MSLLTKQRLTDLEDQFMVAREGKGLVREFGKVMDILLTSHTSCTWVSPPSCGQDNEINLPLL